MAGTSAGSLKGEVDVEYCMAKYSTGGSGADTDGDSCELCGAASDTLQSATIAGAELAVCRSCAPHDDRGPAASQDAQAGGGSDRPDDNRRRAQQAAKLADARKGDPSHWIEQGTNYEDDRLPYLMSGYGDTLQSARQAAGLTIEELAERMDLNVEQVEAVEQNRAARAGVGGSVVRAIEDELDIELIEA